MPSHETRLAGRKTKELELTADEAREMFDKGFRFAEYSPENGRCRLSRPYELIIVPDRDQLTITQ